MTIVCVDNTPIMLQSLKENADKAYPYADVQAFFSRGCTGLCGKVRMRCTSL